MQTSCQSGFLLCWYQNFYLLPYKLGFLAQKRPNLVQNMHFWSFWAKYCHFLHILSNARPRNNVNKVPRWVFCYVGNRTFDFSSKNQDFCPRTTKFGPKLAFLPGLAGSFGALLMGRLVVVARGLYLARHLFTLCNCLWVEKSKICKIRCWLLITISKLAGRLLLRGQLLLKEDR